MTDMTDTTNRTNTVTPPTIERALKRGQIVIGELQPRKHFPEGKVAELAESLKEHGFDPGISRLLVRPLRSVRVEHAAGSQHWFVQRAKDPAFRVQGSEEWETVATADSPQEAEEKRVAAELFELVIGECRYRASEIAGIELLPCAIQEMDDLTALKKQLVENMQRSELTPMEEAMAFQRLNSMGQSQDEIAQSIGRSREFVKDRLVLCRLAGTEVAAALEKKQISASHAEILAKVPAPQLRLELLQKVLNPPNGAPAPWPREELDRHIKLDYLVDLRTAKFDKLDEQLVPVEFEEGHEFENEHRLFGGACFAKHGETGEPLDCPFATVPSGDKRSSARMCTNPQCFQMKEIAAHEQWRAEIGIEAVERGLEVITLSHAENAELWNESCRALAFHSPYVELKDYPAVSELRSGAAQDKSWEFLIIDQAVPIVLGRDTTGKVHELARHDLAKKAAHLNGHKIFRDSEREEKLDSERSASAQGSGATNAECSETVTLETKRQREAAARIKIAEIEAIVQAAEGKARNGMLQIPKPFWQELLFVLLSVGESFETAGSDSVSHAVMQRRGLELAAASVTGLTLGQQLGLVVELVIAFEPQQTENWAEVFAVKLAAVRKSAERRLRKPETGDRKEDESASAQGSDAIRKAA